MSKLHLQQTFLLIPLLILASCNSRPSYVPSNKDMASLLYDIHIMESCFRYNYVKDTRGKAYLYHSILEDHDMTPNRFDSCITWFCYNRREYKDVYNIIQANLSKSKKLILLGKFSIMTEDFPGEYFYTTSNVIPRNIPALQKMEPLKRLDGSIYTPDPDDSTYINFNKKAPKVPYREYFSEEDSTTELSTNDGGGHPYIKRL